MVNNPFQMLANFARQHGNQNVINSPMGKAMLEALESGDMTRGSQLAENYMSSNNMTKDQAMSDGNAFIQNLINAKR